MFTNVGWSEILVLGVVALVVLGPERLPEAARWLAGAIRKVKEFAGNAQQQLRDDYGTDFEEFREPLQQLNDLRGMSPRAMVTKHLLDGDDSLFSGDFGAAAPAGGAMVGGTPSTSPRPDASRPADTRPAAASQPSSAPPTSAPPAEAPPAEAPAASESTGGAGPAAGWDTDAT